MDMADGIIRLSFKVDENLYYDMLSSIAGERIDKNTGLSI